MNYKVILIISVGLMVSSCVSHGLGQMCPRFGMKTEKVQVVDVTYDTPGNGFTEIKFSCVPKEDPLLMEKLLQP
jgi:hypothetical protein